MTYEEFEYYMMKLVEASDKVDAIYDVLQSDVFLDLTGSLSDICIDLLGLVMGDEDEWISYWLYDLDMGKLYKPGSVMVNGKDVPLRTIKDLYNILKK